MVLVRLLQVAKIAKAFLAYHTVDGLDPESLAHLLVCHCGFATAWIADDPAPYAHVYRVDNFAGFIFELRPHMNIIE